jgi:hypothetical protein
VKEYEAENIQRSVVLINQSFLVINILTLSFLDILFSMSKEDLKKAENTLKPGHKI